MTRRRVTPEILARIIAMAKAGERSKTIAAAVGNIVQAGYIEILISEARSNGHVIPYRSGKPPRNATGGPDIGDTLFTIRLSKLAAAATEAAARKRGVGSLTLMISLIETVANDGLFDAVLDDIPERRRSPVASPQGEGERG